MHQLALLPILALLIVLLLVSREDQPPLLGPSRVEAPHEEASVSGPKPFRPVWEAEPVSEGLLGLPLTAQACVTPNCAGCDLDKSAFFRKKPGHPKFQ